MKWNGGFVVNKAKVYCVASAVAVCVASNPNMDVLAKQVQPVKLEEKAQQTITADDFIDPTIDDTFYKDKDYHTMYLGEIVKVLVRE